MKKTLGPIAVVMLVAGALLAVPAGASAQSIAEQIADAVLPLPEDLRPGATVVSFDKTTGARTVLREGTNQVECQPPDMEAMQTICYSKALAPMMARIAELTAEGDENPFGSVQADETIPEVPFGAMVYNLRHDDRRIKLMWVMRHADRLRRRARHQHHPHQLDSRRARATNGAAGAE